MENLSQAELGAYAGLGSAAVTFLATFLVIPQFKEHFREPVQWQDMYKTLVARGVKTVTPEEAYARSSKGAVLLDVRLAAKHAERAAAGSINVPLYLPIQGWDLAANIRRAGFAFFGMYGTELNTEFTEQAQLTIPKGKEVIVVCEQGGTIENKNKGTQFGFQSRSLKAVYFLQEAGYSKVYHMKGGLGDWLRAGLPEQSLEGSEEEQPAQQEDDDNDGGQFEPIKVFASTLLSRK